MILIGSFLAVASHARSACYAGRPVELSFVAFVAFVAKTVFVLFVAPA